MGDVEEEIYVSVALYHVLRVIMNIAVLVSKYRLVVVENLFVSSVRVMMKTPFVEDVEKIYVVIVMENIVYTAINYFYEYL